MLRDPSLIPLSHQHQHVLVLCVRIERGVREGDELQPWQSEVEQLFEQEIAIHFAAEETTIFPAAARFAELQRLVDELASEHVRLRETLVRAKELDVAELRGLGQQLSQHIRKEERQLFEGMQQKMSAEEMSAIGAALNQELAASSAQCLVPRDATRLRPSR